ncbi:MAG: glycosyltransferase family 39 protein [Patescibacteria group bacterium]
MSNGVNFLTNFNFSRQAMSITGILILALLLRLPHLNGSFWMDEAAQALESVRPFSQQLAIAQDFQPPLLHYLVHFATQISLAEWWLRLWGALLPGLSIVFATWLIGKKLTNNDWIAGLSSILVATSSLHIFFSQELRPYALPAAIAIWSWWLITTRLSNKHGIWWLGGLTALGLYSSYLYPFVVLGQLGYLYFHTTIELKKIAGAFAIAAALFAPWLPGFLEQLAVGTQLRATLPGWEAVVSTPQLKALPLVVGKFIFGVIPLEPVSWQSIAALLIIGLSALAWWITRHQSHTKTMFRLFVWWVIVPLISAWIISFVVPVIQPKRVLFALPMLYLFVTTIAIAVTHNRQQHFQNVGIFIMSTALLFNVFGTYRYFTDSTLQREDWRSLIIEIENDYPSDSVVVMAFPKPFSPWEWYASPTFPTATTQQMYVSQAFEVEPLVQKIYDQRYQHVLVFDYLRDLTDPNRLIDQLLLEYGYQESHLYDAGAIGFVRVYSQPQAVLSYK